VGLAGPVDPFAHGMGCAVRTRSLLIDTRSRGSEAIGVDGRPYPSNHMSEDTINLNRLVRRVLVGTLLSALVAAALAGVVWAVVRTQPRVYESKALIRMPTPAMFINVNLSPIGVPHPTPDRKALSHLLKSEPVLARTFASPALHAYV